MKSLTYMQRVFEWKILKYSLKQNVICQRIMFCWGVYARKGWCTSCLHRIMIRRRDDSCLVLFNMDFVGCYECQYFCEIVFRSLHTITIKSNEYWKRFSFTVQRKIWIKHFRSKTREYTLMNRTNICYENLKTVS